jgi:hypothetical protein
MLVSNCTFSNVDETLYSSAGAHAPAPSFPFANCNMTSTTSFNGEALIIGNEFVQVGETAIAQVTSEF